MQRPISLMVSGLICLGLWAGCSKSAITKPVSEAAPVATNMVVNAAANESGKGMVKCMAPGCVAGRVDCPGPCLKLDRGEWIHMDVPGHPPTDLWQQFFNQSGLGGYQAFNQNHVGDVIEYQNGVAVDTGKCKVCGGTGKVACSFCNGTGQVVCPICSGKKFIPVAWTPTDNPWLDGQPDLIRLNDGRVLFGKIISTTGSDVLIKTRNGQWLHVDATNVAPNSETVSTKPTI
jgi:hypothetical protein